MMQELQNYTVRSNLLHIITVSQDCNNKQESLWMLVNSLKDDKKIEQTYCPRENSRVSFYIQR